MSKYLRKAKRKWTMERYQKTSFHSWDFVAKKVQARAMNLNFFLRNILKASFLTGFQGLMWITTLISYDKYCVKFRKMRLFGYVDFFIFRFELWNYPIFCKGVFVNCILSVVFEGFFITAYYGFVMCCDRYWVWFWDSYYIIPIIIRYLIFAIVHDCNHFVNIIWIEFHNWLSWLSFSQSLHFICSGSNPGSSWMLDLFCVLFRWNRFITCTAKFHSNTKWEKTK